jgi:hypothetical protein
MEHEQSVQNLAVEGYLLGQMTAEEREAFENHYFECAVCADDLRSASQFFEEARVVFAAEGRAQVPAQSVPDRRAWSWAARDSSGWSWPGWLSPQLALAAIAVLGIFSGVEGLSTIPSLQRRLNEANTPRIVNPTHLRGQTRGSQTQGGPTALKSVSGEPAEFIFDLPESPTTEAQFVITSADGRAALHLSERLPGGDEVRLYIPRLDLPAGTYSLVVTAVQGGQELGRYLFEIKR